MNRSLSKTKKQYIRPAGYDNLSVIPYIRGRLVFAELAARAIEEDGFEQVVIDFPYFMNSGGIWEDAVRLFPHVSSLLIKKEDGSFVAFPFVPSDAACMSLAAVQLQREWGFDIKLNCIDDSQVIHYPAESLAMPEITLQDDYLVFRCGLEDYFRDTHTQLEGTWMNLSKDQRLLNEYRAGVIAERLQGALKGKEKTLFVCEHRLWWLVRKVFSSNRPTSRQYFTHSWKDVLAALVIERPLEMWAQGVLDDYPSVVRTFYKDMQNGKVADFDKLVNIHKSVNQTLQSMARKEKGNVSIRKTLSFYRYLHSRTASSFRLTPQPFDHLYDSAYECVGKGYAKELARKLLDYPYPGNKEIQRTLNIKEDRIVSINEALNIPAFSDRQFFYTGTTRYSPDLLHGSDIDTQSRRKFIYQMYPEYDNHLQKSLASYPSRSWAVQADYYLHEVACRKARDILQRNNRKVRIKKSWGEMCDGPHWSATLASMARGENALYVKKRCNTRVLTPGKINEHTPISFIFTDNFSGHNGSVIHDSNITQRNMELGNSDFSWNDDPPPDEVKSVFYTSSRGKSYYRGHLVSMHISSITFLYTRHVMGSLRYSAITKRPALYQCRRSPHYDLQTTNFSLSEMGIAWAVHYAEHTVIVVAQDGWKASQKLSDLARQRNIALAVVPLSSFAPDFVHRLRTLHFSSTEIKKHPERDEIISRYID